MGVIWSDGDDAMRRWNRLWKVKISIAREIEVSESDSEKMTTPFQAPKNNAVIFDFER